MQSAEAVAGPIPPCPERVAAQACAMNAPRNIRNIALCGFMGTGKTSVGRLVAEQQGVGARFGRL